MRRIALLVLVTIGLLAGCVLAQSLASQIDFLDSIPGLSAEQKTDQTRVYKVTGNPQQVMDEVKKQMGSHGWHVIQDANLGMVRSLSAIKGNLSLKVNLAGGRVAASVSAQGVANQTTSTASGGIVINDSTQTRTISCNHANVTINGNANRLTLTGTVDALAINGTSNAVQVDATMGRLTVNGSNNTVRWSKGHNPSAPSISNNGTNNQVVEGN
ncbi:MAG: DUF3060 domain-containing protein [Candidatus Xenobia bacterium]